MTSETHGRGHMHNSFNEFCFFEFRHGIIAPLKFLAGQLIARLEWWNRRRDRLGGRRGCHGLLPPLVHFPKTASAVAVVRASSLSVKAARFCRIRRSAM